MSHDPVTPPSPTAPIPSLALGICSAPTPELRAAGQRLGVAKLNCKTCLHGYEDTDGSDGSYWYCGMTCAKHEKLLPETYLEDNGVDILTEKACWHPDFWKAATPEIMDMIDATEESMDRACKAWRELVESLLPNHTRFSHRRAKPEGCAVMTG